MYTDDKNAQIVLSLLKQYGIRKIVVSPGTTNVPISRSVQLDPWFEVYSVVDERSAAYFAGGLAYSSGEPVVISCTGATASRNYMPGLTEAYYRNLPVIALTSQHHVNDFGSLVPQVTDRTVSQNDIKRISVHLPYVKDDEDYERCVISTNKALIAATTRGGGPVHINLQVAGDYSFSTKRIPLVRKIEYYDDSNILNSTKDLQRSLVNKKVAIFIGAHQKFDPKTQKSISKFAKTYNAPVFVDHTSGYSGGNLILIAQIADLKRSYNKPDVIIDMGSVTGEYSANWLRGIETWRLSKDGEIHDRFNNQTKLFDGRELTFFEALNSMGGSSSKRYYDEVKFEVDSIKLPVKDMPISNTYISYKLSKLLPKDSNVHLGILNSLRNMNFYNLKNEGISISSNVGGFGIDGALSTLIGQSMSDKKRLNFGLVGDLATFYDMNALGIRHISKNLRILMVNNNGGVEFRLNGRLESQWAEDTNEFISASGHYGSIRGWAESMGFEYIITETKEDFDLKIKDFCSSDINKFSKPVFFEVLTTIPDEQRGIDSLRSLNQLPILGDDTPPMDTDGSKEETKKSIKQTIKSITPASAKRIYRKLRNRD